MFLVFRQSFDKYCWQLVILVGNLAVECCFLLPQKTILKVQYEKYCTFFNQAKFRYNYVLAISIGVNSLQRIDNKNTFPLIWCQCSYCIENLQ